MFYRRTNQPNRISKTYDEVYSDQAGGATDWLPFSNGDYLVTTVHKGSPQAVSTPNPQVIQSYLLNTSQGFPNAAIVLEVKNGGQADTEARLVQEWVNSSVYLRAQPGGFGFARLRVKTINTSQDGEGVILGLLVDKIIRSPA